MTNVLPQAIAMGNIHNGTIAGKLKGEMPATTPSGWRIAYELMPRDILAELALQELRNATGEFYDIEAADDLALCVGEGLAMLGGDYRREPLQAMLDEVAKPKHRSSESERRRRCPA